MESQFKKGGRVENYKGIDVPLTDEEKKQNERYKAELHAVQSGVKILMETGNTTETTPKHLRVGVNSNLVDSQAVALLLIEKGIFTRLEYLTAVADCMELERKKYEKTCSAALASEVTLL